MCYLEGILINIGGYGDSFCIFFITYTIFRTIFDTNFLFENLRIRNIGVIIYFLTLVIAIFPMIYKDGYAPLQPL
jgi:hypothetical protein